MKNRPKLGMSLAFGLYLGSIVAGQIFRFTLPFNMAVNAFDLVAICMLPWAVLTVWQQRQALISHQATRWLGLGMLWVGLGWMMALWQGNDIVRPVLVCARLAMHLLIVYGFVQRVGEKRRSTWLASAALAMTSIGLLQYVFLPDMRWLTPYGWDAHYYRLVGSILDPNFMGLLFVIWILWWLRKHSTSWSYLSILAILSVSLAFTFSRASWLALAVSVMLLAIKEPKKWLSIGAVVGVLVLGILLAPKPGGEGVNLARTATISARVTATTDWLPSTPIAAILGSGLGVKGAQDDSTAEVPNHSHWPDNVGITVLSGTGLVGIALLLLISWQTRHSWAYQPLWVQLIWISVLIHAQFNNSLLQAMIWIWLWLLTLNREKAAL